MYGVILLRKSKLCQTKLEAKFDKCLFVGYPKEVLGIVNSYDQTVGELRTNFWVLYVLKTEVLK